METNPDTVQLSENIAQHLIAAQYRIAVLTLRIPIEIQWSFEQSYRGGIFWWISELWQTEPVYSYLSECGGLTIFSLAARSINLKGGSGPKLLHNNALILRLLHRQHSAAAPTCTQLLHRPPLSCCTGYTRLLHGATPYNNWTSFIG